MVSNDANLQAQTGEVSGETPKSRVDLLSGDHTSSIIVAILFIVVFIGLIVYLCAKDSHSSLILNGLFSLLSLLGGFFAASQIKKG